jgi:hypothetical protein
VNGNTSHAGFRSLSSWEIAFWHGREQDADRLTARLLAHRACSRRRIEKDGSLSSPALDGAFIVSVTSPRSMADER